MHDERNGLDKNYVQLSSIPPNQPDWRIPQPKVCIRSIIFTNVERISVVDMSSFVLNITVHALLSWRTSFFLANSYYVFSCLFIFIPEMSCPLISLKKYVRYTIRRPCKGRSMRPIYQNVYLK